MSTVLIIGASRGIGLETVKLALKAGHSVRALARSASAIRLRDPKRRSREKFFGGYSSSFLAYSIWAGRITQPAFELLTRFDTGRRFK